MDLSLREEIFRLHASVCGGLADPNRILILYTLANKPHNVSDLAEVLMISQPTVSRHLKTLRGLERQYAVAKAELEAPTEFLDAASPDDALTHERLAHQKTRRELHHKNAELESMGAALERQQAEMHEAMQTVASVEAELPPDDPRLR